MSVSAFHGGLEWRDSTHTSAASGLESAQSAASAASGVSEIDSLGSRDINEFFNPRESDLTLEERYKLCASVGEEIVQDDELMNLLKRKDSFRCYDGFEPSGRMHIAQGIMKSINVNKLTSAGGVFIFWVADWFALLNNKMGGDLNKIRVVGRYFVEVWKAAGMNLQNVQFLWASDEINKKADEYWSRVIDISRKNSITRIKKCGQIMGREEGENQPTSQIMYPCMQCADIFFLKADVCQLGLDQRKVNMLAREYCDDIGMQDKPVIISHHMLLGLKEGQTKMSKSDPMSAIFMEDTREDVKKKIKAGYCPEKITEDNPILDYLEFIIFPATGSFTIKSKDGGSQVYTSWDKLKADYIKGDIHPGDLKPCVAEAINDLLQPVRDHFANDPYARKLLETIKGWQEEIKAKEAKSKKK
jgi:tyrosyl-tRNA synthetase